MDLEKLTARSKLIQEGIATEEQAGYSLREIASSRGKPASWAAEQLNRLHAEVALQTGAFFPLSEEEFQTLSEDISENGVRVPIFVGNHIPIIDGLNRWNISCALGTEQDIPVIMVEGLSAKAEHELSIKLNTHRRQLTFAQRAQLVEVELMRDWNRSDRSIAALCGVDHKTVGKIRVQLRVEAHIDEQEPTEDEIEAVSGMSLPETHQKPLVGTIPSSRASSTVDIPLNEERVDQRGRTHTVKIDNDPKPRSARKIGHVTCCHGAVHDLHYDGEVYTAVYVRD